MGNPMKSPERSCAEIQELLADRAVLGRDAAAHVLRCVACTELALRARALSRAGAELRAARTPTAAQVQAFESAARVRLHHEPVGRRPPWLWRAGLATAAASLALALFFVLRAAPPVSERGSQAALAADAASQRPATNGPDELQSQKMQNGRHAAYKVDAALEENTVNKGEKALAGAQAGLAVAPSAEPTALAPGGAAPSVAARGGTARLADWSETLDPEAALRDRPVDELLPRSYRGLGASAQESL